MSGARRISGDKAQQWRERLASQARSGLTVRAYCRRERLSEWSFYQWRIRLRGAARRRAAPPAAQVCAPQQRAASFIDLGTLASRGERSDASGGGEIRLELGGGIVLHIVRGRASGS